MGLDKRYCQLEAKVEQETSPVEDFPVILSNNIFKVS
jgi:hypothetical protein